MISNLQEISETTATSDLSYLKSDQVLAKRYEALADINKIQMKEAYLEDILFNATRELSAERLASISFFETPDYFLRAV